MTEPLEPSLHAACRRWPDRPAVTADGTTITFAELGGGVARLAASYRRLGISAGDRIVCQLPNSPEHVVAVNAAWAVGAVHVGTDNDLTVPELAWLAERTGAAALLFRSHPGAPDPAAIVAAVRAAIPGTALIVAGPGPDGGADHRLDDLLAGSDQLDDWSPPHGPDDTGHLLLTSGTTGRPKAVMETLPACWAKMQFFVDAFRPGPDDVHLLYLPIAHVFGLRLAMLALLSGGRLVLMERFSPRGALRLITDERVTILPGMPAHFTLLFDALDPAQTSLLAPAQPAHRVDSLRWAISAASTLPRPLVDRIYHDLGVELLYVYGCSENFTVLSTDRDEIRRGSVGHVVFKGPAGTPPDGTIGVLDPGRTEALPAGTVGEIAFGAARPVRYWKDPDAAGDGWYRTGDLGRVDPDGAVYILGRLKELVNRGGLHVSPTEVETAARLHPGVADAAVVATPDAVLGEAVCVCIVAGLAGAPALATLRDFLAPVLARHKLPDELCLVDAIPRTKIGKVDRPALQAAMLAGEGFRERWRTG